MYFGFGFIKKSREVLRKELGEFYLKRAEFSCKERRDFKFKH